MILKLAATGIVLMYFFGCDGYLQYKGSEAMWLAPSFVGFVAFVGMCLLLRVKLRTFMFLLLGAVFTSIGIYMCIEAPNMVIKPMMSMLITLLPAEFPQGVAGLISLFAGLAVFYLEGKISPHS